MMNVTFFQWALFALYSLLALLYLYYFIYQSAKIKKILLPGLLITILFHLFYLVLLYDQLNRLPLSAVFEVMTVLAFIFALLYFVIERIIRDFALGLIIILIAWLIHFISNIYIDLDKPPAEILQHFSYYQAHVITILLSYTAYAIAFISSLMYILLSHEIHKKQLGFFFSRLPSLELLDRMSNLAIIIGTSFISLGMILGVIMATRIWGADWAGDPKLISVFISWIIYCAFIILRNAKGWQGTRASVLSIAGFVWIIISFIIFNLFISNLHSFI